MLLLAATAAVLVGLPAAQASFPGNNGGIAFARGGTIFTAPSGSSVSGATNIATGVNPAITASGQTVAYNNGGQIFTVPFSGGTSAAVGGAAGSQPAWSPGGGTIVFTTAGGDIALVPSGGGAPTNLTNSAAADRDPAVAPSGTRIAFASNSSGTFQIWVMNADGSGQTRITADTSNDTEPTWSPDGTRIAFVSDRGGATQIFQVNSGGGGEIPITNDPGAVDPTYSPDGTLILYSSSGLRTVSSSGSSGAGTPLAGTAAGDVQPDWQGAPPLNTSIPTISPNATPAQGDTLFASAGTWSGAPTSFAYQWQRCTTTAGGDCSPPDTHWGNIAGATTNTYTVQAADVGATISVRVLVTAANPAGSTSAPSLAAGHANGLAPVNITRPTVTGVFTANPGGFVSGTVGTWTGATPITYTFQWLRCGPSGDRNGQCSPIPNARSSFYIPTGDDINFQLNLAVVATNSYGSGLASSAATPYITGDPPHNHVSPTISGGLEIGSVLTSTDGIWTGAQPITLTYQWRICTPDGLDCNSIPGATTNTYTVQPGDYGSTIRMMIRGRNGAGFAYGISNHTFPIQYKTRFGPSNSQPPSLAGPARNGAILVGSAGQWSGEAPIGFRYAWQRCDATGADCVTIPKQKRDTYRAGPHDVGSTIRLVVTATNDVNTASQSSDATDAIIGGKKKPKGRRLVGNSRDNYLAGGAGDDKLYGNAGNDTILGGAGDDYLSGGAGNDVITGGPGSDTILGGDGSDTIRADDGERDTIDCGAGNDRVFIDEIDIVKNCEVVSTVTAAVADVAGLPDVPAVARAAART